MKQPWKLLIANHAHPTSSLRTTPRTKITTILFWIALPVKLEHLVQKVPGFVKFVAPASLPFTLIPTRPIAPNARPGSTNRTGGN
jgi:hypothetical protein